HRLAQLLIGTSVAVPGDISEEAAIHRRNAGRPLRVEARIAPARGWTRQHRPRVTERRFDAAAVIRASGGPVREISLLEAAVRQQIGRPGTRYPKPQRGGNDRQEQQEAAAHARRWMHETPAMASLHEIPPSRVRRPLAAKRNREYGHPGS